MAAERQSTAAIGHIVKDLHDLEDRVDALEGDQSYSQRLSDLEDQLRKLEKAFTSQLGGRLD